VTGAAERLETERLILRMFREDDFEAYYAKITSDPASPSPAR
jgi:RimJ/RimL family protein N-acetyltransferase